MTLQVKLVHPDAIVPRYWSHGAGAIDLQIMLPGNKCSLRLFPGSPAKFGTGVSIAIPAGYMGLLTLRSSAAYKEGLRLVNGVDFIDSDSRGEIQLPLRTNSMDGVKLSHGARIAQLAIVPAEQQSIEVVQQLSETERGTNGFGHTGK